MIQLRIWIDSFPGGSSFVCFSNSEKEEDDTEKREDPGDNWEEGGGGGGIEKSSGPWNKTAPVQAPPAPVIGNSVSVSEDSFLIHSCTWPVHSVKCMLMVWLRALEKLF